MVVDEYNVIYKWSRTIYSEFILFTVPNLHFKMYTTVQSLLLQIAYLNFLFVTIVTIELLFLATCTSQFS